MSLISCEARDDCKLPIAFIVDCDKHLNIFVCVEHVGDVIVSHALTCENTVHVDHVDARKVG